ncbi:transposase [Streptomyces sp. L7]
MAAALSAIRAGCEATVSETVHAHGLRHCRYHGIAKTHVQHVLTAAGNQHRPTQRALPASHHPTPATASLQPIPAPLPELAPLKIANSIQDLCQSPMNDVTASPGSRPAAGTACRPGPQPTPART